jgi:hypothetical protein
MPAEEILVLANSLKVGGRCVAGISTWSDRWVRPVSGMGEGELYPFHFKMRQGEPRLLDIVRFEHYGACEDPTQPENVTLNEDVGWIRNDRLDPAEAEGRLSRHLVTGPELLGDRDDSIAEDEALEGVGESLVLVEPRDLTFALRRPWRPGARPGFRAAFNLCGDAYYDLSLTDEAVRSRLGKMEYGQYSATALGYTASRVLLTVSLGGAFRGRCWKLVAAVFFLP